MKRLVPVLLLTLWTLTWAPLARATSPVTPVIGVNPEALDFGVVVPGECPDAVVQLRNAADDFQSQLVITQLTVTAPFALVEPPDLPLTLPGDGTTIVGLTIRYCASGSGPQNGALTIVAANATNSPRIVPFTGVSNTPPECDAGGPYSGVTGTPITLTGAGSSDPDGTIVAYHWDFGDGQTGAGVTLTHIYTAPGTFDVTLTVTDNWAVRRACTTSAEVVFVPPNEPPACDAGGPYIGTVGQSIAFDGSGSSDPDGTIVAYAWMFGDCGTATGANPEHAYEFSGTYTAELCVWDDTGGSSCCTARVEIGSRVPSVTRSPGKTTDESRPFGYNPSITLPLHAGRGCSDCSVLIDCAVVHPTVNIEPNTSTTIYLMAMNYTALAGVQTAFLWDPSWMLLGSFFDCAPGQSSTLTPAPPGGATAGTVATTFDCTLTGQLLVIGRLFMKAGPTGCLQQVQSTYPQGIHAIDCSLGIDLIREDARLGKICVGPGGIDACYALHAVEPTTWGRVKATYR